MDNRAVTENLIKQIKEYARARSVDVGQGKQTPRFASLLIQKYGKGIADAVAVIFPSATGIVYLIYQAVDAESERVDPAWREHSYERWASQFADVVVRPPHVSNTLQWRHQGRGRAVLLECHGRLGGHDA